MSEKIMDHAFETDRGAHGLCVVGWIAPDVAPGCGRPEEDHASTFLTPPSVDKRGALMTDKDKTAGVRTHELKTWCDPFEAVWDGRKAFEVRKDDRGFQVGDTLSLREWNHGAGIYTGRSVEAVVTYKVGGERGLPDGMCVLGIRESGRSEPRPTYSRDFSLGIREGLERAARVADRFVRPLSQVHPSAGLVQRFQGEQEAAEGIAAAIRAEASKLEGR